MYALIDMQITLQRKCFQVYGMVPSIILCIVVSNFVASLILNSVHVTEILKQIPA